MPRGKNYVNNNKGVCLVANPKAKANMQLCEYGAGCTRPDCIYRHEDGVKKDEVCLPYLAGQCSFKEDGCRKRHPKNDEKARLIAKYKRTRCRHGNDCFTEGCLYLHPREMQQEPNYVMPLSDAFPPLNHATASNVPKTLFHSAWKAAPLRPPPVPRPLQVPVPHQQPPQVQTAPPPPAAAAMMMMIPPQQPVPMEADPAQGWQPMYGAPAFYPASTPPYYVDPAFQQHPMAGYYDVQFYPSEMPMPFNAEAKEFVPGNNA